MLNTIILHLIILDTKQQSKCLVLSILAQVDGIPEDLTLLDIRRQMIIHLCENIKELYVSKINLTK